MIYVCRESMLNKSIIMIQKVSKRFKYTDNFLKVILMHVRVEFSFKPDFLLKYIYMINKLWVILTYLCTIEFATKQMQCKKLKLIVSN